MNQSTVQLGAVSTGGSFAVAVAVGVGDMLYCTSIPKLVGSIY